MSYTSFEPDSPPSGRLFYIQV